MEKNDPYDSYNHSRYVHYRQVKTGEVEVQHLKGGKTRIMPQSEKRVIPFDEIKEFQLDEYGTLIPQADTEDFTIVANYLLDFWGSVLGSDAVTCYLHLKRYAYGKKDYCFPDIELISLKMERSINTVKKCLRILEEHHFIAQFNRYDSENKNREVSPFFKIRRLVPLITEEMYAALPDRLKNEHDRYMAAYKNLSLTNGLTEQEMILENIVSNREIINKKSVRDRVDEVMAEQMKLEYSKDALDEESREVSEQFVSVLERKVQTPSFNAWLRNLVFKRIDESTWTVYCPNELAREWIAEKYDGYLHEWLHSSPSDMNLSDVIKDSDRIEYKLIDELVSMVK